MAIEKLTLKGFIDEVQDVSEGNHPRRFCFVLGAGASVSSGIMSGQQLVNIWEKDLKERNEDQYNQWKLLNGITDENKYSHYSDYYECRYKRNPIDGYNYLEKIMGEAKPKIGYVMLAYILTNKEHNVVITTNFDHLTEDAISYFTPTMPLIIGHESLAHYISIRSKRPTIIKIHRDLLFDPKSKASELESLHDNWKNVLDSIFKEYSPIFIGYAGNDNSLMDFLLGNTGKFLDNTWKCPYWLNYKQDKLSDKVQKFLEETNGYLIKHNGFDETLYHLGIALGCNLPTKSQFLKQATNRYATIEHALKSFDARMGNQELLQETQLGESIIDEIDKLSTPDNQQEMYLESLILSSDGHYDKAVQLQQQLIDMDSQNASYHNILSYTYHAMGNYEEALLESQKAIELDPNNPKYHESMGATLHKIGRYDDAILEKQKAVELDPEESFYHSSLGTTYSELGRYEEAVIEKQKAIDLEPTDAYYRNSLSITLFEMKKYEESLKEIRKAIELDSKVVDYYKGLSLILYQLDNMEESIAAAAKVCEMEPNDAQGHFYYGACLHEVKRYAEAVIEKQKAIELDPHNARYHNSLSDTLYDLERYDESLLESRKAIELDPDNARYHYNLGITLHIMKQFDEAIAEKQKAIFLDPDVANYHYSLGLTLHQKKMYADAISEIQNAIAMQPNNFNFHRALSLSQLELGLYDESLSEINKAIELSPENEQLLNVLKIINNKIDSSKETISNIVEIKNSKDDVA